MKKIFLLIPLLLTTFVFSSYEEQLLEKATKHYFEKEFKKAYDLSVQALIYYPKHPYAHLYIGTYFSSIGKVHDAINYFDKAISYHDSVFPTAHWERAFCKMIINKDLSYCEEIKVIKENLAIDDSHKYLEDEHPVFFGLCELSNRSPSSLIKNANYLASHGYCSFSQMFYNEASKNGSSYVLANYDESLCE